MKKNEQQQKIEFTEEEKKLLKKYIEEYNDLYQKILILSESDLFENIQKRVEITEKSKFKNYSPKSIQIIEDYIKENIYIPDYKFALSIKKSILNRAKRELALHYFRGEIIPHCAGDQKDNYYIHTCGERLQFFRFKSNNNISNIDNNNLNIHHGIHYDYILYCIKCNMIYKSSLIKFKCFTKDIEFYSKLLINNDESKSKKKNNNNCYATWKKYHCNAIINDTMKCNICEESYIFFHENNILYCPKCKFRKNPLDITWKCLICQKDFQAEAKIYNPLEYKSLKICVKDAIVNKIKAKPEYMACKCEIDINTTKFFHKSACKGELYLGEINSQKVVVCGKCDTLGLYEGYIWTCPNCLKRFKTKKREGSVCNKLGLTESTYEQKESNNKDIRNLSERNKKKNSGKQNNIDDDMLDINNYLNDKNNNTISPHDNDILNYLHEIKDSMNINNINKINISNIKDNKIQFSNINKKRTKNPSFKGIYSNSFIEDNNNSKNYKNNNLSFSEKCIPSLNKKKEIISNNSFSSKICNNILSGNLRKDMTSNEKEEFSSDSKLKSARYIINNYKKKSNFHIKNNFQLKTENKEKDSNLYSNFQKKNIPFSLNKINQKIEKFQSESKDKNNFEIKSEEFFFKKDENGLNLRKLYSYRKPYYSINNSFINSCIKDNRKSKRIIRGPKKDIFSIENKDKDQNDNDLSYNLKDDKNENEITEDLSNIKENLIKGKLCSAIEDTKKKYKKKNKIKKYIYNSKDTKNLKNENKIIAKALNFAEKSIKDMDNNKNNYISYQNEKGKRNNNLKLNKSNKLRKNNNININININNSSNNINENLGNINEINNQKRIFSNSIIMNNFTINDKDNILNSLNFRCLNGPQNYNIKKSKTIIDKNNMNNINSINNINTNININNINNNLHYYNQINNDINCLNNNLTNRKTSNYPTKYRKKIHNKNSDSTTAETEHNIKNNINNINNLNKSDNKINQKYLFTQKFRNFAEYKIIKQIGKGTFGQIFMVENNQHQYFALKKLIATNLKDIKTLEHEYQILLDIQSHGKKINLVQIYGIETRQLDPTTYVMYVLMELASTDWEKEILTRHNLNKYYNESELMNIISSLITTFAQLQKEKISHRDIKPQNILIFKDSKTYKLADFGEAKELLGDDKPIERQTLRGTELYMSPILFYALRERIKYVQHNPYKSDVFSFGLCCLFASTLCFESIYDVRELRNNSAIRYIVQKYLRNRYSNVVINIICSMLDVNENSRNDFIEMEKEIKKIGY